ncbi:MAG: hypothetical protein JO185_13120, partial [Acidobacteriaceae bacterium]|nr:hypothetical protein [Acidobacteriaceae bacterium]
GRIQSSAYAGTDTLKKNVRMIAEGSVLSVQQEPVGTAVNVAPDGFPHPVYRLGFSLSLKLPNLKEITEPTEEPVEATPPDSPLEAEKEQRVEVEEIPAAGEIQKTEEAPEPVSETAGEESERSDNEI